MNAWVQRTHACDPATRRAAPSSAAPSAAQAPFRAAQHRGVVLYVAASEALERGDNAAVSELVGRFLTQYPRSEYAPDVELVGAAAVEAKGEYTLAAALYAGASATAEQHHRSLLMRYARYREAWSRWRAGDVDEAIKLLEAGVEAAVVDDVDGRALHEAARRDALSFAALRSRRP